MSRYHCYFSHDCPYESYKNSDFSGYFVYVDGGRRTSAKVIPGFAACSSAFRFWRNASHAEPAWAAGGAGLWAPSFVSAGFFLADASCADSSGMLVVGLWKVRGGCSRRSSRCVSSWPTPPASFVVGMNEDGVRWGQEHTQKKQFLSRCRTGRGGGGVEVVLAVVAQRLLVVVVDLVLLLELLLRVV